MLSKNLLVAISTGDFTRTELRLLFHLLSLVTLGSCEVPHHTNLQAVKALGSPPSTISRAIGTLEERQILRRFKREGETVVVINPNLASRANELQRRELREAYPMPVKPIARLGR